MTQVIDSDRYCPRCHKKMMLQVGQDDVSGWTRMQHECWACDYTEIDENWRRPLPTRVGELGKRLAAARREVRPAPKLLAEFVFDPTAGAFRQTTVTPDWACPRCEHRLPVGLDREASLLAMGRHLWAAHPGSDTALLMTEVREVEHAGA